jgi:hypothetical protein
LAHRLEECRCAWFCNSTQILNKLSFGHTDSWVSDADRLFLVIVVNFDL